MWSTGFLGLDLGLDNGLWMDGRYRLAGLPRRNHRLRANSIEQRELRAAELA